MTKVATKKDSEVLSLSTVTQDNIPAMLKIVTDQIKALKGESGISTITASLPGFGVVKDIKTVESVVKAHSMLTAKSNAYTASAKALGIKLAKFPFKEQGHSLSEWVDALTVRLNSVKNEQALAKLEKAKVILKDNLSQEMKLQAGLKDIQSLLLDDQD